MRQKAAIFAAVAIVGAALCLHTMNARGGAREENSAQALQNASSCDRKCLYGFVDQYLQALAAKDPSRLPWAASVKFTENNVQLDMGDGLWGTITGIGPEDVRTADPSNGQAAYMGVVSEHGEQSFFALRLKIDDHKISEVETIVDRKGLGPGPFGDPAAMQPLPILLADVPQDQRSPRAKMIALADGYFNTLQLNDGHIFTVFDPACGRRENGVWTASDPHPDPKSTYSQFGKFSCEQGFKLGNYHWDDRVRDRRFPLVDEEKGLVLAGLFIDHSGRLQKYTTTDGVEHESPVKQPHSFCALELFKIQDGKIRHAESVFITVPYNMPSPWVKYDP
ncbi:MAG TPA: hypothetical protein VHX36_06155 [Candidatus Acidoferrales bacterium]|jgi:hypothetical protein|nr:hypothetical protein [Candidatus Acidoferrales bacterium]